MVMPAGKDKSNSVRSDIQIANVTRPLLSASKICRGGELNVLCKKDEALVLDSKNRVVARFEQRNGLYVAVVEVKNPKASGFPRQDA